MHDQGGAEEVQQREGILDARRARKHEQDRQQARADQRGDAQPQPGSGQLAGNGVGNFEEGCRQYVFGIVAQGCTVWLSDMLFGGLLVATRLMTASLRRKNSVA